MIRNLTNALRRAPALRPTSHKPSIRCLSFQSDFLNATSSLKSDGVTFQESADRLRTLTKTNLLKPTDIRDAPAKFFESHRLLARHAVTHGPGFWIRYTVHYNLFAGTVLAVGNDSQVNSLQKFQDEGLLGCFSLTEKLAGVQSGLVVQTTATWDNAQKKFILNTPTEGARKNWISQGFTADKTVVLADLIVGEKSRGPHAFLMDFRKKDGSLCDGITADDMGVKTVGNDLDNAWLSFDKVVLPHDALLSKYAEVDEASGEYNMKVKGVRPFDMIGQRLYTGRVAVAQAALEYRRELFRRTKEYSDNKSTFAFKGSPVLSDIPQLTAIYKENEEKQASLDAFVNSCELALSECLKNSEPPSSKLVDAIATCKVRAVEESISMCFRLKQEVGSFALMADAGFKHMDFLQCCKFAEGDSRILMQKMARDAMKSDVKTGGEGMSSEELRLCKAIGDGMAIALKENGGDKGKAWDSEWVNVYALAEAVMKRVQSEVV